jgi:hypothetical protein
MPVLNSIYTIREVITLNGHVAVRLVEIKNPVLEYGDGTNEMAFRASRFRPVVERKTDISIFTAMLKKKEIHYTLQDTSELAKKCRQKVGGEA